MGLLTLLQNLKKSDQEVRILVLGLDNSGKTTVLNKLSDEEDIVQTMPTEGFNIKSLTHDGFNVTVWDIRGQTSILPYWKTYYDQTDALIYVIDSADRLHINETSVELQQLLGEEKLAHVPILVLANKQDVIHALTPAEITAELGLNNLSDRKLQMFPCSASTGEGLQEGMEWLVEEVIVGKEVREEISLGDQKDPAQPSPKPTGPTLPPSGGSPTPAASISVGDQKKEEVIFSEEVREEDAEDVNEREQGTLTQLRNGLQKDLRGVTLHASTVGDLEAMLTFLRMEYQPPIPVAYVNIGPIHKRDVDRASLMHEKNLPEFATIFACGTGIDKHARVHAEKMKVKVFFDSFDLFVAFMRSFTDARKALASSVVVFPVKLRILPDFIFHRKDPILIGVEVLEGTLRVNTPLCVPQSNLNVGRITRMEINHKEVQVVHAGAQVAICIENESNPGISFRQFRHTHALYSKISRASIDACKEFFSYEMTRDDWLLMIKLKKVFNIA